MVAYPIVFPVLVSFVLALATTLACERLAWRAGLVVQPREDRWHRRPVPLLGGVAIAVGALPGVVWAGGGSTRFGAALIAALAMAAVGFYDDLRSLRPPQKLIAQIVVAGLFVQIGLVLRLTHSPLVNVFLTLFWFVGITNAFNLLDNMDGLAAGLAVIAAGFRLAFFTLDGDLVGAQVTAAFLGALGGFLVRNLPPARIFMGDTGSLFVGAFLAGLSLVSPSAHYSRNVFAVLAVPALLMLIPIFDTTFVTVTRILTGAPVSRGGRDHTSHRLVALGIGERGALACLCGVSLLSGFLAVLSYRFGFTHTVVFLALLLVGLVILGVHLSRVQVVRATQPPPIGALVRLVEDFPFKRHVATIALDLVLIVLAYYSAYLLRFEDDFEAHRGAFTWSVAPVIVLQLLSLALSGAYRGLWRYTSVGALIRILGGVTLGSGASAAYFVATARFAELSRAVFVVDWLLLMVLVGGTRLSFRLLGEVLRQPREGFRRVLIYGAGDGGELTLRELRQNPALGREPVGFLDDDRSKTGLRIHEVPVLGSLDALGELLIRHRVAEIVVSSGKISSERIRRLEAVCEARGVTIVRVSVRME